MICYNYYCRRRCRHGRALYYIIISNCSTIRVMSCPTYFHSFVYRTSVCVCVFCQYCTEQTNVK